MRDFNDADRKKKSLRIELSDNPATCPKRRSIGWRRR